jgi:hypothetical protein
MLTRYLTLAIMIALLPSAAHAGLTAVIQTNSSSLAGESGYVDLQFNAFSGAQAATVTIFDFSTNGVLGGCPPTDGCVFGDVTGGIGPSQSLIIQNGATDNSGMNDFTQGITFGTNISFLVTFSGPAVSAPDGSGGGTFSLTYYDTNFNPLLSANGPGGASLTVTVDPFGVLSPITYSDANGAFDTSFMETPEPASFFLVFGALTALGLWRNRAAAL